MGSLHTIVCIVSGSIAFLLNSLLSYIILATKKSSVGKYKHLLFLYSLSAAIYASNQVVTAAEFALCSDGFVFYDTLGILSYPVALIFIENYTACFLEMIAIISWCFVYRYCVSLRAEALDFLHRNARKFFLGTVTVLTGVLSCYLYSTFPRDDYATELETDFYNLTGKKFKETANNCLPLIVKEEINWKLFWGLGQFVLFIALCAIVNMFCAVRIAMFLKKCFAESQTANRRQKRIFTLLMLQFLFPLSLNMTPVFLVLISPYLKIPTYGLENIVGAVASIAQIIDPLMIFFFIDDYRHALRNLVFKGKIGSGSSVAGLYSTSVNNNNTPSEYVS